MNHSAKSGDSADSIAALQNLADISGAPINAPASWSAVTQRSGVTALASRVWPKLYEAWSKPAQAAEWKQKLEALKKSE